MIRIGFDRAWSYEAPDINNVDYIINRGFWYLRSSAFICGLFLSYTQAIMDRSFSQENGCISFREAPDINENIFIYLTFFDETKATEAQGTRVYFFCAPWLSILNTIDEAPDIYIGYFIIVF